MIRLMFIAVIFLTLTFSLAAQDSLKTFLEQDGMGNSKQYRIRWAGTTLGFKLSEGEEVLLHEDNAIIIGRNGHPSKLIATYTFTPEILSPGMQVDFINLKTVILGDFGSENGVEKFNSIPEWLATLPLIESLVLSNAELTDINFFENLPLKYLVLQKVNFTDKSSIIKTIGNLERLNIFVHDQSFSPNDLSIIKEKLPNIRVASKSSIDKIP